MLDEKSSLLDEMTPMEIEEHLERHDVETLLNEEDVSLREATLTLVKVAVPSWFALFFQILLEVINITFVGNLNDPNSMATVGLSSLVINAFLFGPGYGIWGGIDTLVATAYGNKEYYLCGVYLNRGRIIQLTIVSPLILLLLLFGKKLFLLMGQDDTVAQMTQEYLYIALPGAIGALQFQITKRFLQAQKIFNTIVYFQIVLLIQHVISAYMFIYYFELGVMGAAIAHSCTNILAAVSFTLVLKFIPGIIKPESFHFFNKDSFHGWKEYLHLGFPAMVVTTLQWASYESMGMFAGILGVDQLGAHTALSNIHAFNHMIPLGTSFGSGALIGNALGLGKYKMAKTYAFVSIYASAVTASMEVIILVLFHEWIFRLYTQEERILDIMRSVLIFMLFAEVNSHFLGINKGIIKAMGRQSELARYTIVISGVLANLFAVTWGFYFKMGLPGIWLGLSLSATIGSVIFTIKIFISDWYQESKKTLERLMRDKMNLKENHIK
jgi:multidrug resistance protein, MATE family